MKFRASVFRFKATVKCQHDLLTAASLTRAWVAKDGTMGEEDHRFWVPEIGSALCQSAVRPEATVVAGSGRLDILVIT